MSEHWTSQFRGKPYRAGAMGPDAYCCASLVSAAQRVGYGRDMPAVIIDETCARTVARFISRALASGQYGTVAIPRDGDIVAMGARLTEHVGVYVVAGSQVGVLHADRGSGQVRFSSLLEIKKRWPAVTFHRATSWR